MHYYPFNIGDYASHTTGLSLLEDLAYRRLMDEYYLSEQPLNGCSSDVARMIGMRDHCDEVDYVLSRFFKQEGDKWIQNRIEKEIETYKSQKEMKSKAGRLSGKARRIKAEEQALNTCSSPVEQNVNSVELTKNQEPRTNNNTTPKSPRGRIAAIEIKTYIDECKAAGVKTIRIDDPVFEYAAQVGIPDDFLRLAWLEFRDRSIESGKRYKDWPKSFRNFVRGNYLKLWWLNSDNQYELTTAGKQAQQKHARQGQ